MPKRIIDLSYEIHDGMTTYPTHWHPLVEVSQLGRHGIENRETRKLVLGTHTGTHCDAPRHFVDRGTTIDQIPAERWVGPAVVLDFSGAAEGECITEKRIEQALAGRTPERLLLRYDWSRHWGTLKYYIDHPFLSEGAAHWLVQHKVKLIGMDTPTPDNPKDGWKTEKDSPVHKILLGQDVLLLEYLCNMAEIRASEVELIALPLKIRSGDGGPTRCVVIEEC